MDINSIIDPNSTNNSTSRAAESPPKRPRVVASPSMEFQDEEHPPAIQSAAVGNTLPDLSLPSAADNHPVLERKEEDATAPMDCATQTATQDTTAIIKEEDGDVAMTTPTDTVQETIADANKQVGEDVPVDPPSSEPAGSGDATMAAASPGPAIAESPIRRTRSGRVPTASTPSTTPNKKVAKRKRKGGNSGKKIQVPKPRSLFSNLTDEPECAFCGIPGNQPSCEGELLGPFIVSENKSIFAHRACLTWAPEVFINTPVEGGPLKWHNVSETYARAKRNKCFYCKDFGASLGCSYKGKSCCRPMHFRCALLVGATISLDFNVLCPNHKNKAPAGTSVPVAPERKLIHTPIDGGLLAVNSTASCCDKDNFDPDRGNILHCGKCRVRLHSNCLVENFQYGGLLSIMASKGEFRCKKCMNCSICKEEIIDVNKAMDNLNISSANDNDEGAMDLDGAADPHANSTASLKKKETITCSNCHHMTVHRACVDGDVTNGWRCDTCRHCYHCGYPVAEHHDWFEANRACRKCEEAIVAKGAICPTCEKVWRADVPEVAMIFCDTCERWLHREESCSKLTLEKYEALSNSDERYDCPPCMEKIRNKEWTEKAQGARTKKQSKKKREKVSGASDEEKEEPELYYASSDEEDGVEYKFCSKDPIAKTEKNSKDYGTRHHNHDPNEVLRDAGPNVDLCDICGSSSFGAPMRYCGPCGKSFHGFCLGSKLPELTDAPMVSSHPGTKNRLTAGGVGENATPWTCSSCAICHICGEDDKVKQLVLCDHCDRGVHMDCLSPPLEAAPEGAFFCEECRQCEMCGTGVELPTRIREHLFCESCASRVESAKPCSVCKALYPLAARPLCSREKLLSPQESQSMELTGALCTGCDSVIHSDCDPSVEDSASYRCPVCRSGEKPAEGSTDVTSDLSQGSDVCKQGGICHGNGIITHHDRDGEMEDEEYHDDEAPAWEVDTEDRRRCELCGKGEKDPLLGRLIPLRADAAGSPKEHMWMHIACVACSGSTIRVDDTSDNLGILVRRKELIANAKKEVCTACGKKNATIKCAHLGCRSRYHIDCALDDGVKVGPTGESRYPSAANSPFFCKNHTSERMKTLQSFIEEEFPLKRKIRTMRMKPQERKKKDLKQANAKRDTLVRGSAVSVLSFGRLVPESGSYLIRDKYTNKMVIVPTGYRATKRFWSMKKRGKRTLYCMEVRGDASWGPEFSVWNQEDESDVIRGTDIDEVWGSVRTRVREVSGANRDGEGGLDAFGLNLRSVGTLIESMPMAWMFKKRYIFRFRNPTSTEDPDFEARLLHKDGFNFQVPGANKTGCARTEGYIPKKLQRKLGVETGPQYTNKQSGMLFQIGCAMENAGYAHLSPNAGHSHLHPRTDEPEIKAVYGVKGRRNKISEGATLSDAVKYRIMIDRQQQGRSKHVVERSRIAGFGTFLTEDVRAGEFIAEYTGELIRQGVSDLREPIYEKRYGSLYLFSLQGKNDNVPHAPIIDATQRGGISRYINHTCDANCQAREITTDNDRQVVIIEAIKDTRRGEELGYDYRLSTPAGEERQACSCGSLNCRGFMDELEIRP